MLPALFAVYLVSALTPQQSRTLVERYSQVQAAVDRQDYARAAGILQDLCRNYGNSEYGDELQYVLAEIYFNQGRYDRALAGFRAILDRPRYSYIKPEAMYGIAVAYIMMGNFQQARATLERLSRERGYDLDPRTSFAFGVLHYFQREYDQAIAKLEGLEILEAKFYLARCYASVGRPLPALLKFKEIVDNAPNTPLATMSQFAAGQALFQNRDYDGARAKFQLFVDNFPYSPLADYAHYFLGCALIALGENAAAIEHLMPLTRHSNNYLAAHANYFIGYANMALGQSQQAVERFQRVRANYPRTKVASFANLQLSQAMLQTADTTQTLLATSQLSSIFTTGELSGVGNYLSGVIHYQVGDYQRAANQFENLLINYGSTSLREPAAAMLLLSLNSLGDFEKTVALGAKYTADFPNEASPWRARTLYFLAEGLYYSRKYSEADACYYRAYTQQSNSDIAPYAQLGRCYCLYHLGRLDEAGNGFRGLLTARTSDTLFTIAAYLGYGYSLFNQKEYLKALDVFEALANTFPEDSLAAIPGLFYAGYCYYQLQYFAQAIEAWKTLMNRFPESGTKVAEAAFRTGDTYFKALEYDKAVAAFTFVIERYPFSHFGPPAQALIAQCCYNRRQYTDAIREYQKFLDLYPSDPQVPGVRRSLEMSYYLAGQEDSSLMEDFLRRFPQSEMAAEGQYQKGRALYEAQNYQQAVIELQKTVVNFPGSTIAADAQLLTGEAYAQLQRWPEAAQAFQKYLDYFPSHEQRAGAYFNLGTARFNAGEYDAALAAFRIVIDSFPRSDYAASARTNIDICRRRLGIGPTGPNPSEQPTVPEPDSMATQRPSTQGERRP